MSVEFLLKTIGELSVCFLPDMGVVIKHFQRPVSGIRLYSFQIAARELHQGSRSRVAQAVDIDGRRALNRAEAAFVQRRIGFLLLFCHL